MKAFPCALLLVLVCCAVGCEEPAEVVAGHFEQMALIAETNRDECELVGERLDAYLETHRSELESNIARTGESDRVQASRIAVAAERMDKVIEPCRAEHKSVEGFADKLSALVLQSTGLGARK